MMSKLSREYGNEPVVEGQKKTSSAVLPVSWYEARSPHPVELALSLVQRDWRSMVEMGGCLR